MRWLLTTLLLLTAVLFQNCGSGVSSSEIKGKLSASQLALGIYSIETIDRIEYWNSGGFVAPGMIRLFIQLNLDHSTQEVSLAGQYKADNGIFLCDAEWSPAVELPDYDHFIEALQAASLWVDNSNDPMMVDGADTHLKLTLNDLSEHSYLLNHPDSTVAGTTLVISGTPSLHEELQNAAAQAIKPGGCFVPEVVVD
jgi:hypothetical protein